MSPVRGVPNGSKLSTRGALFFALWFIFATGGLCSSCFEPDDTCNACEEPRVGVWLDENRFPLQGPSGEYTLTASGSLRINKVTPEIYNGTGVFDVHIPPFTTGVPVSFVAMFNWTTCALTGTGFSPMLNATETFVWYSTGTTLSGYYLATRNEMLTLPYMGYNNLTFVE